MSKVSIIIPAYNSEKYIAETIQSALNQTFASKEIIVIDDGSEDNTYEIASSYQEQGVVVLSQNNKGACVARNYGLELSSGKYVQFLDADDLLSPKKVEKQVEALSNSDTMLAVCETWNFDENIEKATNADADYLFSTNKPEDFLINLWGGNKRPPNMVQTSAWLTPRALIEKAGFWDESLAKDQDGEFFARVAMQSKGIIYVPGIKNYYRKINTGLNIASQRKRIHMESQLRALQSKEKVIGTAESCSSSFHVAMALQYKWIAVDAWPQYKDISDYALMRMKKHGYSNYVPLLGGRMIEGIRKIFGWKVAKNFAYHGRKILAGFFGSKNLKNV